MHKNQQIQKDVYLTPLYLHYFRHPTGAEIAPIHIFLLDLSAAHLPCHSVVPLNLKKIKYLPPL